MFAFEADLDPAAHNPRIRWNFANGWTASIVLRTPQNGCNACGASLAAWPHGKHGFGLTEIGPTEASADEAARWIDDIRCREPV